MGGSLVIIIIIIIIIVYERQIHISNTNHRRKRSWGKTVPISRNPWCTIYKIPLKSHIILGYVESCDVQLTTLTISHKLQLVSVVSERLQCKPVTTNMIHTVRKLSIYNATSLTADTLSCKTWNAHSTTKWQIASHRRSWNYMYTIMTNG